jgi:hypothetical protein
MEIAPKSKRSKKRPAPNADGLSDMPTEDDDDDGEGCDETRQCVYNHTRACECDSLQDLADFLVKGTNKTVTLELLARLAVMVCGFTFRCEFAHRNHSGMSILTISTPRLGIGQL